MPAKKKQQNHKEIFESLLGEAGISVNGGKPHDIRINNNKVFDRVLSQGSLGLGESYMDGWWDCERLDEFFYRILNLYIESKVKTWRLLPHFLKAIIFNPGAGKHSFEIGERHYDIGNSLYQNMLDKRLVYSCGYWEGAKNLNEAQEAKLDLACRKLRLKRGMRVLDIGCGWGSFLKYAAENYGVEAVGITVSQEQVKLGRELCKGLPVEIRLQDYRELDEKFDHIVSIGMFEHVGYKNYRVYMKKVANLLNDDGLFLLHTIGNDRTTITTDPWINKYIFPGGMIPSIRQIGTSIEKLFIMEDWHNFGADYDKTLMAWHGNFTGNWKKIKKDYDERFYRMWSYYLLSCAGSFRARRNQLWQIVLSKRGVPGGYKPVR
jgi:cyclopropane-fatty-acyl-phospholipid synthase